MNVFITGATGYVGSAVAKKLKFSGHDIFALARSDNSAGTLNDLGYSVIKGDMLKPDAWKQAANLLVSSYRVKNTKAKRILGWNPQYPAFRDSLNHVMKNN